ncbi:nuclear transport factor 2 family protein [Nocardia sp. NPDC004722]
MRLNTVAATLLATACLTFAPGTPASAAPACDGPNAETRAQIDNLFSAYGPYFDYGQADAWAGLFTEDGVFSFPGTDGNRQVIHGRTDLAAFAAKAHQPGQVFAHYPGKTLMIKEGGKIHAFTPVGVVQVDTTKQFDAQFSALGAYDDIIALTPKGPRFESRTAGIYGDGALPDAFTKCQA